MSERRSIEFKKGPKRAAALLLLLSALMFLSLPVTGSIAFAEALIRLFVGFFAFLRQNLPRISSDAGTWGPGVVAFLLTLVVIHRIGRSWARHRQRVWRFTNTLAAGMVLPLLFAISFLVPGVILQVQRLSSAPWFVREFGEASYYTGQLKMLGMQLIDATSDSERYPDTLQALVDRKLIKADELHLWKGDVRSPGEPVLYLGKGLTTTSDPSLPLLVSPPYSQDGSIKRIILTVGYEAKVIPADELDAWIERTRTALDPVK